MLTFNCRVCLAFLVVGYLFTIASSASGILNSEQDDSSNPDEKPASHIPEFISKPQTFYVELGQSATMECQVKNLDPYVLMWKKGEKILSVNNLLMAEDSRYDFKQFALKISDIRSEDAGEYTCQISTNSEKPVLLINSIRIKSSPKIHPTPRHSDIEVKEGEFISLRCQSEGQPPPKITWQNEEVALRPTTGVLKDNNETLEFSNISGSDAGQFECIADNGVGSKAKNVFRVRVKHAPKIKLDKNYFPAGDGVNLEVVCSAKADPPAKMYWYKDGKSLHESGRVHIKTKDNHSTIRIQNSQEADFGKYKCEAKNEMGTANLEVEVAGSLGDQRVTDTQTSAATPETVKELKSLPSEANGSPSFNHRDKIAAVLTVVILIAFF